MRFSTTKTGRAAWDKLLESAKGNIENMSPDVLMDRMAKGQGTTTDKAVNKRLARGGQDKVNSLIELLQSGVEINAPVLDYATGGFQQDGFHRALAAKQLGMDELPVAVIRRDGKMPNLKTIANIGVPAAAALAGLTTSEDAEASFGGKGALMFDEFMEGVAKKMHSQGMDPAEIFKKTNFIKMPDGQWKFEIPDVDAKFTADMMKTYGKPDMPHTVGDAMDHPLLFANYPELKDISTKQVSDADFRRGLQGSFRPPTRISQESVDMHGLPQDSVGKITVPGRVSLATQKPPAEAKSTMIHELGHGIQEKEGWQGGENDANFNNVLYDRAQGKIDSVRKTVGEIYDKRHVLSKQANRALSSGNREKYEELMDARAKLHPRLRQLQSRVKEMEVEQKQLLPYGQYLRASGEAEARLAQRRNNIALAFKDYEEKNGPMSRTMRDLYPKFPTERDPGSKTGWDAQGGGWDVPEKEILVKPEESPAYRNRRVPTGNSANLARNHGEMYSPENPLTLQAGNALSKIDTPFGNPVGGIAELLQHLGMYGFQGGNKYSEVEPQTGMGDTVDKSVMAAIDVVPLAKRALPLAPAIAKIYELAKAGQE